MENNKSFSSTRHITNITQWIMGLLLGMGVPKLAQGILPPEIPDDIKQSIRQRIDNSYNAGIIVGIINPQGTQYYSYGKTILPDGQLPNENTIFEIGSVTKVFTALLLADMAEKALLNLQDPIEKFLPDHISAPAKNGRSIKLIHLATHTSGLPRMPDNIESIILGNPYEDYTLKQMYKFLSNYQLPHDIGEKYEYSNYGMGLLGHLLARHSDRTFEQLIKQRITDNLGMSDTFITLTKKMKNNFASGYCGDTKIDNWNFRSLQGAGAMRSTANDMLTFLAANIGLQDSPLRPAMDCTHKPHYQAKEENLKIGLSWRIITDNSRQIHWHNGGTGGYFSFIGMEKAAQTGIVVLTNSQQSVDDIGFHFFLPDFPLGDYSTSAQIGKAIDVALLPGEKLPNGEDIIRYSIKKTGGYKALGKIQNRLIKANLNMKMFGIDCDGSQINYQTRPNKFYTKIEISDLLTIEQGNNGDCVWEISSMTGARILTGSEKDVTLLAYNFDMANYKQIYKSIQCVGKAEIEGQMCYKVILTPKVGRTPITQYFIISSGENLKTEYFIEQEKTKICVESWGSDFKQVDGILYPHHTREKVMNVITHANIESIDHNVKIPAGLFDLPEPVKKIIDEKPDKQINK